MAWSTRRRVINLGCTSNSQSEWNENARSEIADITTGRGRGLNVGALTVGGIVVALFIIGWVSTQVTDGLEHKAVDVADRAFFGRQRRQARHLGAQSLRIRTELAPDRLWQELRLGLPLPAGKPRFGGALYSAGMLPSAVATSFGMRVNWEDDIQSAVIVYRADGTTVCEHAMVQWAPSGMVMRNAAPNFQALRETLVSLVRSLDPTARATLVDDDEREIPFEPAALPQH